jgi:DNA-binding CsgD family transcriptional regulator
MQAWSDPSGEWDQIRDRALARLRAGQGRHGGAVLMLHGAPGVGISHRLDDLAARARSECLVWRATAIAYRHEPYQVWREVLAQAEAHPDRDPYRQPDRYHGADTTGDDDHDVPMSARTVVRRLGQALQRITAPTIIIIDHWHEADPGSRRILDLLNHEIAGEQPWAAVLIVIGGDHSSAPVRSVHSLPAVSPIHDRVDDQLVAGPEPADIADMLAHRYPGAVASSVAAATTALLARCGHNYAAITIALRSLESVHGAQSVLDVLITEREASTVTGSGLRTGSPDVVTVGQPRQMIAQLVGLLSETERTHLGIWILGAQYSRTEICVIAGIEADDLEAAIRAAQRRGLIPSVWISAAEVHRLVVDAVVLGLGAEVFQRIHRQLGDRAQQRGQVFTALHHYLSAGAEVSSATLLAVLREGWRAAQRWRAHEMIEDYRQMITHLDADPSGSDPEWQRIEHRLLSEMESTVDRLVSALSQADRAEVGHHLDTLTEIADRADIDALVAQSWTMRAVQALLNADAQQLTHCRVMVERYRPAMVQWAQIAQAQLSADWSEVPEIDLDPVLNAYLQAMRGEAVTGEVKLGPQADLFAVTLAALVAIHRRDPSAARDLRARLDPDRDKIAVHPEGLMVLGPVASVVADLIALEQTVRQVPEADEASALRAHAVRIARQLGSPWMIASVTKDARRSLLAHRAIPDRALEVARLLAQGDTNAEIAERLNYSPSTVRRDIATLVTAVGASDRADLIKRLKVLGFVDIPS